MARSRDAWHVGRRACWVHDSHGAQPGGLSRGTTCGVHGMQVYGACAGRPACGAGCACKTDHLDCTYCFLFLPAFVFLLSFLRTCLLLFPAPCIRCPCALQPSPGRPGAAEPVRRQTAPWGRVGHRPPTSGPAPGHLPSGGCAALPSITFEILTKTASETGRREPSQG